MPAEPDTLSPTIQQPSRMVGSIETRYYFPLLVRVIFYAALISAVIWPRYLFFPLFGVGVNPFTMITLMGTILVIMFAAFQPVVLSAVLRLIRLNLMLILVFIAVISLRLLSTFTGQNASASLQAFVRDLPTFFLFILFLVAFIDSRVRSRFVGLMLALSAIQLILALLEFGLETSIAATLRLNVIGVGDANALEQIGTSRVRDGAYRAQALFAHPIVLGQFAAALVPLAATLIYRRGLGFKLAGWLLVAMSASGAYASGTRSALILLSIGVAVFFVMGTRKSGNSAFVRAARIYAVLIAGLFVTVYFADDLSQMVSGRTAMEMGSTQTRQVQFDYSVEAIERRPVMGYGLGNGIQYSGVINGFGQQTLDNFYLSLALDTGFLGLGSFLLMSILGISAGVAAVGRTVGDERYRAAALLACYIVLVIGHAVHSIIDTLSFELIALAWLANAGRDAR